MVILRHLFSSSDVFLMIFLLQFQLFPIRTLFKSVSVVFLPGGVLCYHVLLHVAVCQNNSDIKRMTIFSRVYLSYRVCLRVSTSVLSSNK